MDTASLLDLIRRAVSGATIDLVPSVDMPTIVVDRDHLLETFSVLRDHQQLQFAFLSDVTAVDRLPAEPRFDVVYHLACLGEAYTKGTPAPARRLRVKVGVPGDDPRLPSVVSLFPAANWPEREVFDLFAIVFEGHPDLRRILMPDDWEGAPLRKDYPVQIRKTPQGWSPVQLTAEEFAENIRAQHAAAEARAAERHQRQTRE
jgi:NADH-quinone oxidoreductase subunit C